MRARHLLVAFALLLPAPSAAPARSIVRPARPARPAAATAAAPRLAARDLFADRMWDDGRAEISIYEGTIECYGKPRPLKARIIVVKEDMETRKRVKSSAGPGPGTRPVLKQNWIQDFRTGTYDYHQMCSTFLDRATGQIEKLSMSSTEGCGMTFVKLIASGPKEWTRTSHSYWDDEADREQVVWGEGLTGGDREMSPADALPLWLRRLDLEKAHRFELALIPSQVSSRVGPLKGYRAQVYVAGRPDAHGLPVTVSELNSPALARVDRYWFDPAWPHPLVRFEGGNDRTVMTRVRTTRLAYWNETDPGDERLLEGGR